MQDLVIRGAAIYDGLGNAPRVGDVAVRDGRISAVGEVTDKADATLDANGLALAPGFVDLHTHYDAQITWDPTLSPSPSLGVTTVVMGNCGFGIAPCKPAMRDLTLKNLSVVEGMELSALEAGTRWDFESFPEFMAMVRRRRPYLNVAVFAQHSTIRGAVMGPDAGKRAEVTTAELEAMKVAVREALHAGAIGFASSFSPNHSGWAGLPMPSTLATDEELDALIGVLGEQRRGVFMLATGTRATPQYMEALVKKSGRPGFISTVRAMYNQAEPDLAKTYYDYCAQAIDRGHELYIQSTCQPLSFQFDLHDPYVLYSHGAFDRVRNVDDAARVAAYRDPAFRDAFRANLANSRPGILFYGNWNIIEVSSVADARNAGYEGQSIAAIAQAQGKDPLDVFFDLALADNLQTAFVGKFYNNDDRGVAPLISHRAGVIALSDAGAHLKFICDAGYGLHLLGHWVRDQKVFTLTEGIRRLTSDPARKYRIPDRGELRVGAWADMLLFDPATVGISKAERVVDLPGGGGRLIRRPRGVHGVWVNGQRVFDGVDYAKLDAGPGQLIDRFVQ